MVLAGGYMTTTILIWAMNAAWFAFGCVCGMCFAALHDAMRSASNDGGPP